MKKAALHNLGCKVNAYETEAMQQQLVDQGYEIVPFQERADVYVINTCSVTNIADRKSRQMLHRAKKLNPDSIVVAVGCYVETAAEQLKKDPAVDLMIGNHKKHELAFRIDQFKKNPSNEWNHVLAGMIDINTNGLYDEMSIQRRAGHTRAFVKVQDGCNQFCSYCIIPYARGRVRSRKEDDILNEVTRLSENGYREIVLTGIHLSSYGVDNEHSLLGLIKEIHDINGIMRIRFGSLEPQIITEEWAKELAGLNKVCPHFHLSLQSGCDETLKRMNRQYTTKEYKRACEILRGYFSFPAITTDVIVGFPGETEKEFLVTRSFIREIAFAEAHIFKYSPRKGTRAAVMPDQIAEKVKTMRSNILFQDINKLKQEFISSHKGEMMEVLLEEELEVNQEKYFTGYSKNYIKALVKGSGYNKNQIIYLRAKEVQKDHVLLSER